jgi:hypothetical protein
VVTSHWRLVIGHRFDQNYSSSFVGIALYSITVDFELEVAHWRFLPLLNAYCSHWASYQYVLEFIGDYAVDLVVTYFIIALLVPKKLC